jgi:TolA-binding protein
VLQDHLARHGEAAALLEAYLERPQALKPLEAEAMVRLARAQLRSGRTGEARALLRKVVDRFPGTTAALQARRMIPAE